jgi:hypothetical protein
MHLLSVTGAGGRLVAGNVCSNPAGSMNVCFMFICCDVLCRYEYYNMSNKIQNPKMENIDRLPNPEKFAFILFLVR